VAQGLPDGVTSPADRTAASAVRWDHGRVRPTDEDFRAAWPRVVRILAAWSGSIDDAEEYAAEAMARVVDQESVDDLAAWCVRVAKRAWVDDHRRRSTFARIAPEVASREVTAAVDDVQQMPDGLDDRVALLFVACDDSLAAGSRMVLALRVVCGLTMKQVATHLGIQESTAAARLTRAKRALAMARGEFRVPGPDERRARLPVVLDCVAGMFTVAHRTGLRPRDALSDLGAQALSIADALVSLHPDDLEVRGLRAVVRLGLARRPGRVDASGVALPLAEVDRSAWDQELLRAGLADATVAARGRGRFALEAAISGLHSTAPSLEETAWPQIVLLYQALREVWPSPAVDVALLAAQAHLALARHGDPGRIEQGLRELAEQGPSYAGRDAGFALADLLWRSDRHGEAARLYRELAARAESDAVRRFCLRRADGAA
jgi:RNA polymerase sigma factor (sigma-70 family)